MATVQQDLVELRRIKNRCIHLLSITSAFSIVTLTIYLAYRLKTILEAFQVINEPLTVLCSALFLAVETGFFLPKFLEHLLRCLAQPSAEVPCLRLSDGERPPLVDVLITCAGEDTDTVVNTTEAACALEYPPSCFRVIVLDDAGSKEFSRRVDILKKDRSNLFYTARDKGDHHNFKAGNLNHGYDYVETLDGGAAPFIAALDADMIPDPQWLLALMPHLLRDRQLALVQPPQVSSHNILY